MKPTHSNGWLPGGFGCPAGTPAVKKAAIGFYAQGRARKFAAKAAPVSAAAPVVEYPAQSAGCHPARAKLVPQARSNRAGEQEPTGRLLLDL